MHTRTLYSVLGVDAQASPREVRTAYRELALRYHPDAAGGGDGDRFLEVRAAYDVLGDPIARRAYDYEQGGYSERRRALRFSAPVEEDPSTSYSQARHQRQLAPGLTLSGETPPGGIIDALVDAIDLLAAGFVHDGRAGEKEHVIFELVLSPEEAAHGGEFAFTLPVRHRCNACMGTTARRHCLACAGRGTVVDEPELHLLVPPGVHDGQTATLPLDTVGVPRGTAAVTVRID
jgi:DnaJ-class molecular chaperone